MNSKVPTDILKEKIIAMQYNNLPVFNIVLDSDEDGLHLVSLVDYPAVCESFLKFKEEHRTLTFTTDNEQHIISGVSLLADTPIYRNDGGEGYYVVFTKDTIKRLVEKYNRENRTNLTSLQHNGKVITDCIMVESYFIDKDRGICPKEFEHCPDGSWITSYKVTSEELWDEIKNSGELNGFSVEISCQLEPAAEGQLLYEEPGADDFWDELWGYLTGDFESKKKTDFSLDKGDIIRALEKRNTIKIDEGGGVRTYFPHSLGRRDGKDVVILYDPSSGKWSVRELGSIGKYIVTTDKIGEFDYSDPSYGEIMDDDSITVSRSTVSTGDGFIDAIKNRTWVQIAYDDEQEPKHTGYRQCMVVAYGYTHAGNVAVRCYQQFGDTRTTTPDYKIFLVKRMQAFKPMTNTEPWNDSMLDSRFHSGGDKNLNYPLIYAHKLGL